MGVRGIGSVLGAGRDCRYSEARQGIRELGFLGSVGGVGHVMGHQGTYKMSRVCWGLAGTVGTQGPEGG